MALQDLHGQSQLYFCYGDDMNPDRLRLACERPVFVGPARLAGFRLVFAGHSKEWDGGTEALVDDPAGEVWGAVYRLSRSDADCLDALKGIRLNGTGTRFHYFLDVVAPDGAIYETLVFQKTELGAPTLPGTEYLETLITGAELCGLPRAYLELLRSTPSRAASYPVPRRLAPNPALSAACDCGAAI